MVNLDSLRPALVHDEPYRWASIPRLIDPGAAAALRESFPVEDFFHNEGEDGEKTYQWRLRPLITQGSSAVAPLPSPLAKVWHDLVGELVSPAFRSAFGHLLGIDLTGCRFEADMFRLGPGCWIGPHRDLPGKLASLIVYLNDDWDPAHGGTLRVLHSHDEDDATAELAPIAGTGALIVRSRRSWHSVTRVADQAAGDRISIQLIAWRASQESTNWTVDEAAQQVTAGRRVLRGRPR